jgi:acyl-CoA thioesterase
MANPEQLVRTLISRDRVCRLLGIELVEITAERSVLTMTVTDDMTNGAGVCQGGIIFTLADTAMAMVASTDDEMALATTGTIDWVRSAVPGDVLTATGTTRWKGKRPSLHDAVVTNQDGVEIAHFHGRMQRLGGTLTEFLDSNQTSG